MAVLVPLGATVLVSPTVAAQEAPLLPVSEETIETAVRRVWDAAVAAASGSTRSKPGLRDDGQRSRRTIGDTTVVTTPSGTRIAVTVDAFEDGMIPHDTRDLPRGRWVLVHWTLTNRGTTDESVSRLHFRAQTANGNVFGPSLDAVHDPALGTARLAPGQSVRGWLTYDIPSGQRISSLIYQPPGEPQFIVASLEP